MIEELNLLYSTILGSVVDPLAFFPGSAKRQVIMTTTSANGGQQHQYDPTKIWTTLLTNRAYFGGLLVLDHSLRRSRSRYQLKVMVTREVESDEEYMRAFVAAGIPTIVVDDIQPAPRDGKAIPGTWQKLAPWSFTEYEVGCRG